MQSVSPKEAYGRIQSGGRLVDVRSPAEFREIHAEGAVALPLGDISADRFREVVGAGDQTVCVICGSGKRSAMAIRKLEEAGVEGLINVEGGTAAWEAAGLPVRRGKAAISLERQVRIGAGSLVLAGVLLGTFVHAGFYGLSAFVGAGLVFAGITDTCGMGMLLSKAPWNR